MVFYAAAAAASMRRRPLADWPAILLHSPSFTTAATTIVVPTLEKTFFHMLKWATECELQHTTIEDASTLQGWRKVSNSVGAQLTLPQIVVSFELFLKKW